MHQQHRQQGKIIIVLLLLLLVVGGVLLFYPMFTSESTSGENAKSESLTADPLEIEPTEIPSDEALQTESSDISTVKNVPRNIESVKTEPSDTDEALTADELLQQQEQRKERLNLMKTKAQEYSVKRLALLQKCRDYEVLGMLEEKKLECLDYLAEKRADQEVKERQELRKTLKRKFDEDG